VTVGSSSMIQEASLLSPFAPCLCICIVAYAANLRSMYRTVYQAAFWTMRKTDRQLPTDLSELVQLLALNKAQQRQQQQQPPSQQQQPGKQQQTQPNEEKQQQQQPPQQQQQQQQSTEQQGMQQQEQPTHSATQHQGCCLQAEGCVQLAVQPGSLQQGEQQVATQQPGLCSSSALQRQSCQHTMQRPKVF